MLPFNFAMHIMEKYKLCNIAFVESNHLVMQLVRDVPDTGVSGTHLEPGCRVWNAALACRVGPPR